MKSNLLLKFVGIVCLIFCIASCTKDDTDGNDEMLTNDYLCQEADSVYEGQAICNLDRIANYGGTACCVSGPVKVNPGESMNYTYHSNIPNAKITWNVISGSIAVTGGQNTQSATFKFGDDFTSGCIQGYGDNEELCSESIRITTISNK